MENATNKKLFELKYTINVHVYILVLFEIVKKKMFHAVLIYIHHNIDNFFN